MRDDYNWRMQVVLFLFMIGLFISSLWFLTHYSPYAVEKRVTLNKICLDLGYKELTDKENVRYDRPSWEEIVDFYRIECDGKVLDHEYILNVNIHEVCIERDKWKNCKNYDTVYNFEYEKGVYIR